MIDNLDELIELTQKKATLLIQMKQALEEEAADYIVCQGGTQSATQFGYHSQMYYILVHKKSKENLIADNKKNVLDYIKRKRLTNVYWRKRIFFNNDKKLIELV